VKYRCLYSVAGIKWQRGCGKPRIRHQHSPSRQVEVNRDFQQYRTFCPQHWADSAPQLHSSPSWSWGCGSSLC